MQLPAAPSRACSNKAACDPVMKGRKVDFSLYLITDRKLIPHGALIVAVEDALKAGVKAVQLREKDLAIREVLELAYRMREITTRRGAKLFINDRVDVALCVEADGVHLGQSGIPVKAARKLAGSRLFIGASAHNLEEVLTAEREGADFITFGPVYDTPSKRKYGAPVGIELLRSATAGTSVPVFGIGGITIGRVAEVLNAGACGIALISGILGNADVKGAAAKFLGVVGQSVPRPS